MIHLELEKLLILRASRWHKHIFSDKKTGLSLGYYRTLEKIALWPELDDIKKDYFSNN